MGGLGVRIGMRGHRVCTFSCAQYFVTPWTVACQAPLSMGILQARILEWVAITFSRGSSRPRDLTFVSWVSYILYHRATWEALGVRITQIQILAQPLTS